MISRRLLILCVVLLNHGSYCITDDVLCMEDCREKKLSTSDFDASTARSSSNEDDLRPLEVENGSPSSMSNLENLIVNYVSDYIPVVGQTLKVPGHLMPAPKFFNKALGMAHPCCLCCRNLLAHCRRIGKTSCDGEVQICCRQSRRRRRHWKSPSAPTTALLAAMSPESLEKVEFEFR